jgi:SH3-like domain-containing protein
VVFTPLEKKGDWLKVRHPDGTNGWINKDLVWPSDPLD